MIVAKRGDARSSLVFNYRDDAKGRVSEQDEKKISPDEQKYLAQQAKIDDIKRSSFQEGYNEGVKVSRSEAVGHIERVIAIFKEVSGLKAGIIRESEEEILRLALAIAKLIIRQEVKINRDYIYPLLQETIKGIVSKEELKIRLNPDDLRYMTDMKSDFMNTFDELRNLELVEDPAIKLGGAVIETKSGDVDARIDRQLIELEKELFSTLDR